MPNSSGEQEPTEAQGEPSDRENLDQTDNGHIPQETDPAVQEPVIDSESSEPATDSESSIQSEDWWKASAPVGEWAKPSANFIPTTEVDASKESATADVYFCGRTILLPLNRVLQAIGKEELTGVLRAFWDRDPIELLAKDGTIAFVTTRDPDLYCPETPAVLANVDAETVAQARAQQSETGAPFFFTLARQESIAHQPAMELVQHYGQKLFSQLWAAPRVWVMFEKNTGLLSEAPDAPAEQTVDNWALETLRFVENLNQHVKYDPTSIPAYTKEGFERIQKLKLTSDEAQFASQFNGVRSVQQIAKNLRLDLKSARLMLFRFLALEIVECWPASTATKPEPKSVFQRFKGLTRRGR